MQVLEADYGLTAQALDPMNGGVNQQQQDARLRVTFGMFPEIDQTASLAEGRPIFRDEEYIQIMVPGERDIVHRKVWAPDKRRFALQYAAFRNNNQEAIIGTPLKLMPWITLGQLKELEYFNCSTVEQLAGMPDSTAAKFMQVNKLKQLAKDHIEAATKAQPLIAMRAEIDKRDNEIDTLKAQMAALMAKFAEKEESVEED